MWGRIRHSDFSQTPPTRQICCDRSSGGSCRLTISRILDSCAKNWTVKAMQTAQGRCEGRKSKDGRVAELVVEKRSGGEWVGEEGDMLFFGERNEEATRPAFSPLAVASVGIRHTQWKTRPWLGRSIQVHSGPFTLFGLPGGPCTLACLHYFPLWSSGVDNEPR